MIQGTDLIRSMLKDIGDFCRIKGVRRIGDLVGSTLGKKGYYDRLPETARMGVRNGLICRTCFQKPCIEACFFDAIQKKVGDGSVEISEPCTAAVSASR